MRGGQATVPGARRPPRRWVWPVLVGAGVLAALVLLGFGGLFDRAGGDLPRAGVPARRLANETSVAAPAPAPGNAGAVGAERPQADAAVILKDDSAASPVAVATSSAAPAAAASRHAADQSELSRIFTPPAPAAPTTVQHAPARRAAPQDAGDSDVDLLTMLMKHVEAASDTTARPKPARSARKGAPSKSVAIPATGSVELALKRCPAANTEAGIACRQRICVAHQGQSPACPKSSPEL